MRFESSLILAGAAILASAAAEAHEIETGKLMIVHPWVRATTAGTATTTGYAKITNKGAADRLIGASLAGANGVILSTTVVAGIAKMQPLPKACGSGVVNPSSSNQVALISCSAA